VKPIKPDVANLSVTTHGSVFWNDELMGDEQLAQRLQASAPRQPQPEDFIRGDRLVDLRARRPGDGGYAEVRGVGAGFVTDQATTGVSRKTPP
jgi:biopolymer transport protein ExbD